MTATSVARTHIRILERASAVLEFLSCQPGVQVEDGRQ